MRQKLNNISLRAILITIGIGVWVIVLQNAGVIPKLVGSKNGIQTVYVTGGSIDADINGTVNVSGSVSIDNEVDVDIKKVNGWNAANYYEYKIDGREFHSLGTR